MSGLLYPVTACTYVCITSFPQCFVYVQMCAVIWISGVYVHDDRIGTVEPRVNSDGVWHVRIHCSNTTYVHTYIHRQWHLST